MEKSLSNLRIVAGLGLLVALPMAAMESLPLEQGATRGALVFGLVTAACLIATFVFFRKELRTISANVDLLVPYGVLLGLVELHKWIQVDGLGEGIPVQFLVMKFSITWSVVLMFLLWVATTAWTTHLVVAAGCGQVVDAEEGLKSLKRSFWRFFIAYFLGYTAYLLLSSAALSTGAFAGIEIALVLLFISCLLLNLGTMALLPVVITSGRSAWGALGEGIQTSWRHKRKWLGVVLLQWALLGGVKYLSVRQYYEGGGYSNSTNFNVTAKWLGGYEHSTEWYSKYCEVAEISQIPFFTFILSTVFMLLAIAVKLRVVSRLPCSDEDCPVHGERQGTLSTGDGQETS